MYESDGWRLSKFKQEYVNGYAILVRDNAFGPTWQSGLLYKLSEVELSISLIKLSVYFLTNRKFKIKVEGEFSTAREVMVRETQSSVLAPVMYSPCSAARGVILLSLSMIL
jgi:hypothetical protein